MGKERHQELINISISNLRQMAKYPAFSNELKEEINNFADKWEKEQPKEWTEEFENIILNFPSSQKELIYFDVITEEAHDTALGATIKQFIQSLLDQKEKELKQRVIEWAEHEKIESIKWFNTIKENDPDAMTIVGNNIVGKHDVLKDLTEFINKL